MELVIVPVTLLVGMALIYFGVNGSATAAAPQMAFASTLTRHAPINRRKPYTPPPAPVEEPGIPALDLSPSSLRQQDVLLVDLMTEMIEMRSEISKIKAQVAAMTPAAAPAPIKVEEPVVTETPAPESASASRYARRRITRI